MGSTSTTEHSRWSASAVTDATHTSITEQRLEPTNGIVIIFF